MTNVFARSRDLVLLLNNVALFNLCSNIVVTGEATKGTESATLQFVLERNQSSRAAWSELLGAPDASTRAAKLEFGIASDSTVNIISRTPFATTLILLPSRPLFPDWENFWRELPKQIDELTEKLSKESDLAKEQSILMAKTTRSAKETTRLARINGLLAGITQIQTYLPSLHSFSNSGDLARWNEINDLLDSRPTSQGFFQDILTDDVGISFHRFQLFIGTIVLSIIFVTSVHKQLAMPDFNDTLLALMGISSGMIYALARVKKTR